MPNESVLPRLLFSYEVTSSCGCGCIHLSDGVSEASLETYCHMGHPISYLVNALEKMLNYESEGCCTWWGFDLGGAYRLIFNRTGDALHVQVLWFRDPPASEFLDEGGNLEFSTTCDLWKFAAKLRLEESRIGTGQEESQLKLKPQPKQRQVYRVPGYKTLEEFLEEHKRQLKAGDQKRNGAAPH